MVYMWKQHNKAQQMYHGYRFNSSLLLVSTVRQYMSAAHQVGLLVVGPLASQEVKQSDAGAAKTPTPGTEPPTAPAEGGAGSSKRASTAGAGGGNKLVVRDDAATLKEVRGD